MTLPPTKTHRVSVPITQKALERFQRFSEVSGVSIGKSISQWLDDTSQGLEPMTEIVRGMKAAPRDSMNRLINYSTALEQTSHDVIEAAMRRPEGTEDRARDALAAPLRHPTPTPPPSNTGGKVSKKVLQKRGKSS